MNPMTDQGNKKSILIIIALFFIIFGISLYFVFSQRSLIKKLRNIQPEYERLIKENAGLSEKYSKLDNSRKELETEFKNVCAERDALVLQAKNLRVDKNRIKELENSLAESKKELEQLRAAGQTAKEESQSFKEEIKRLDAARLELIKENKQLKEALSKEERQIVITKLKQENADLQREKNKLADGIKRLEPELRRVKSDTSKSQDTTTKLNAELKDARGQIAELKKNYADALSKNKALERKVIAVPAKFSEIARQNIILKKRTASMHYNLGVFYLNQKEYARASIEFEKAVELMPDDAASHFNLGYIYAEYLVDRKRAVEQFRYYLKSASKDDKDYDWVQKYVLTWQTWENKKPME